MLATLLLCLTAPGLAYSVIAYGEISDNVRLMQQALKDKGYFNSEPDGVFGPETLIAICQFQSDQGLTVDGNAGDKTLTALYDDDGTADATTTKTYVSNNDSGALRYGSHGNRVKQLQSALDRAGYYNGLIDGDFRSVTESAVIAYQRDHYLYVDGVVGSETWTSLFSGAQSSPGDPVPPQINPGSPPDGQNPPQDGQGTPPDGQNPPPDGQGTPPNAPGTPWIPSEPLPDEPIHG